MFLCDVVERETGPSPTLINRLVLTFSARHFFSLAALKNFPIACLQMRLPSHPLLLKPYGDGCGCVFSDSPQFTIGCILLAFNPSILRRLLSE